jgi:hypothetical protein
MPPYGVLKSFVKQADAIDPTLRDTSVYEKFKDLVCKDATFCKAAQLISVESLKERVYATPTYVVAQILQIKSSVKSKTINTENASRLKSGGKRDGSGGKAVGGKREIFYDRMVIFRCARDLSHH